MRYPQDFGVGRAFMAIQTRERVMLSLIGAGVIFASLGLGEAVYRLLFFEFDGATDRLPIEILFGLAFAWMATKLVKRILQYRKETSARIQLIREHNCKIRHAVGALSPLPYASKQQAIRVIREKVESIDSALTEIITQ